MILVTFRSWLLASAPIAISRSTWRHSSPIDGSRVLVDVDAMGISTWRAGTTTLWIASIEETAASTYDFLMTHGKTNAIM
jgi:hypothetical protein